MTQRHPIGYNVPMRRRHTPELMDEPDADRGELADSLRFIERVNAGMGGVEALLRPLRAWSAGWPAGRRIELLDIATGAADLPIAAVRWANGRGLDLRVTAIDVHATTLGLARERVGDAGEAVSSRIELIECDAFDAVDRFGARSFDYVHAGLFIHHLESEIRILTMLAIMDRLARAGVIWNDLVRSTVGYWFICLRTMYKAEMVKHDARVSVRAGFSGREARDLAVRAGWDDVRYRWNLFTHRFCLTSQREGAWL